MSSPVATATQNAFGCPAAIAETIALASCGSPLLTAVAALGPSRVQWAGNPPCDGTKAPEREMTSWALDGRRATLGEIVTAAASLGASP